MTVAARTNCHIVVLIVPKKKVLCDNCGRINIYPWEKAYEQGSSLWEDDNDFDNKT